VLSGLILSTAPKLVPRHKVSKSTPVLTAIGRNEKEKRANTVLCYCCCSDMNDEQCSKTATFAHSLLFPRLLDTEILFWPSFLFVSGTPDLWAKAATFIFIVECALALVSCKALNSLLFLLCFSLSCWMSHTWVPFLTIMIILCRPIRLWFSLTLCVSVSLFRPFCSCVHVPAVVCQNGLAVRVAHVLSPVLGLYPFLLPSPLWSFTPRFPSLRASAAFVFCPAALSALSTRL
jgi:hypothetical protein